VIASGLNSADTTSSILPHQHSKNEGCLKEVMENKLFTEESSRFTTIEKENDQLFKKLIPNSIRMEIESEEEKRFKGKSKENSRRIHTKQTLKDISYKKIIGITNNIQGRNNIIKQKDINRPVTSMNKSVSAKYSPIKPVKHYNEWEELNKSINEMKQKISERLNSASKVEKMRKAKSVKNFTRVVEKKRNSSRKRQCENCFRLMSKGFSLLNCFCRKTPRK